MAETTEALVDPMEDTMEASEEDKLHMEDSRGAIHHQEEDTQDTVTSLTQLQELNHMEALVDHMEDTKEASEADKLHMEDSRAAIHHQEDTQDTVTSHTQLQELKDMVAQTLVDHMDHMVVDSTATYQDLNMEDLILVDHMEVISEHKVDIHQEETLMEAGKQQLVTVDKISADSQEEITEMLVDIPQAGMTAIRESIAIALHKAQVMDHREEAIHIS